MNEKAGYFNARVFWEKIKDAQDILMLENLSIEFLEATQGRKLTDDEMTVDAYLKARVRNYGVGKASI